MRLNAVMGLSASRVDDGSTRMDTLRVFSNIIVFATETESQVLLGGFGSHHGIISCVLVLKRLPDFRGVIGWCTKPPVRQLQTFWSHELRPSGIREN